MVADGGPAGPEDHAGATSSRGRFAWAIALVVLANAAVVLSGSTSQGATVVVLAFLATLLAVALLIGAPRR